MSILRTTVKKLVKLSPLLEAAAKNFIIARKIALAREFMVAAYLFPQDCEEILADYRYSLKADPNRSLLQVMNIEEAVRHVASANIKGAFVETGTFTGGASAFALRAIMRNEKERPARPYWGFDSFEGMPKPTGRDGAYALSWMYGAKNVAGQDLSGALEGSDVNLAHYDTCLAYLLATSYASEKIKLVKGWFQNTLPVAKAEIGSIAILRLDGDFYESTKVVLENLFPIVSPGGMIIVDDYGGFEGCKAATDEYLAAHDLRPYLHYVDHTIRMFMKSY